MKTRNWSNLNRAEKLGAVAWPELAPPHIQTEMKTISAREGKRSPAKQALLKDSERGCVSPLGNLAKPLAQPSGSKK
jgi:hypothetical protein